MDKQAEIARIKAEYEARNKEIERQHRLEMAKIIGGGLLSIGSAFIPGTAGLKVAGALGKTIAPMVGKKIGTEIASGLVSGGLSGAVEGIGRGLIENKNPLQTMTQDSLLGTATGGLGGLAMGKIGQGLARRGLYNNPTAQKQYVDDYIADLSNKSKAMADFRGLSQGAKGLNKPQTLHDIIKDNQGNFKDFYHASNSKFDKFDKTKIKENKLGLAFNFTDDLSEAYQYGDNLYKVNLDMNNPLTLDKWEDVFPYEDYNDFGKRFLNEPDYNYDKLEYEKHPYTFGEMFNTYKMEPEFIKTLQDMGYDGLSFPEQKHYGVFEPEQIKIKTINGQEQFAKDLVESQKIQNAINKINNNPNKPLQELVFRNGKQVGYGDYFDYNDNAIYIDYLRNITKDTPNYQKGVGSEIMDKILQKNPNKNIIWDAVDNDAEAFKQAYLKKHPELTPYVFQQGDYDQLVALAKDQGYNINDYLELLRGKSKKTGL